MVASMGVILVPDGSRNRDFPDDESGNQTPDKGG